MLPAVLSGSGVGDPGVKQKSIFPGRDPIMSPFSFPSASPHRLSQGQGVRRGAGLAEAEKRADRIAGKRVFRENKVRVRTDRKTRG